MSTKDRPVALITGATRGLGLAIAQELSTDHHIVIGGRNEAQVRACVDSFPSASPFIADLTIPEELKRAYAQFENLGLPLDVLIHNAGVAARRTVAHASHEDWSQILATNVIAVADLTRLALPLLRASQGLVITINSGAGVRAYAGDTPYCASKWALRAFTECLREEERGRVRVCSIHPGRIDTDMQKHLCLAAGDTYNSADHMPPAEVARTVRLAVSFPHTMNVDELRIRTTEPK
ncbi:MULTISPECIES: SDR family oxidoreductase [unclassified Schaalia]|uniref:SDR family oxidoreductase n=1 Tax=unclassified Schaalia TaxID=2691889 RepID=UPI001E39B826|nr:MULTISPECIES: SDR family oxidoreductase [unclassified Schaalia]MCD4549354.1 SDR family oxidoreductase [Schaalia sp. lx-260]MCD4557162.1 SDR family oxidoreductase [Schaalia sp. lx-100]